MNIPSEEIGKGCMILLPLGRVRVGGREFNLLGVSGSAFYLAAHLHTFLWHFLMLIKNHMT